MSGLFGLPDALLGPTTNVAKNSIKEGLKNLLKTPARAERRRMTLDLAEDIRKQAGPGMISKKEAKTAAKGLVQNAQEQKSSILKGVIRFGEGGVDVSVNAVSTATKKELNQ